MAFENRQHKKSFLSLSKIVGSWKLLRIGTGFSLQVDGAAALNNRPYGKEKYVKLSLRKDLTNYPNEVPIFQNGNIFRVKFQYNFFHCYKCIPSF